MSPLDPAALESIRELQSAEDPDVLVKLIDLFLESLPLRVGQIEKAVVATSGDALRNEAHSLKSSSASLGMSTVSSLCAELEQLGKTGKADMAAPVFARLKEALNTSIAELNALPEMLARTNLKKAG